MSWLQQSPCLRRKNWSRGGDLGQSVLGAVVPSAGGAFSEQLDDALQRGVRLAYLVVRLRAVLMRRDTSPDLGVGQKLTTTIMQNKSFNFSCSSIF